MPIYEYACKACNQEMEFRQRFSDDPLTDCPECGASALERLVSNSNFALKGSGWYADGYSDKKPEAKKDDAKKDTKDAGSKDGSDSKTSSDKPKETAKPSTELKKAS